MQRDQNGADIPDKPLFVKTLGIVDSYPVGCPIPYPGPVAPDGYLLMDGRSFSKTLYPQLAKFYVAGVLPDMRGMYVRGWTASYSPKSIDTPQGMNGAYNSVGIIPYDYGSTRIINGKHPFAATERTKTLMPGAVSPRGYDIYQLQRSDRFEAFEGGGRQLLSTQYYERLIENPDYKDNPPQPQTAMIVNKDSKYNDSYNGWDFYELPTDEKLKSVTFKIVRGLTPVGSIDSTWNRINLDSKEIIDDVAPYRLIEKKLMPIGVPNVAFNYITKAA
ncbi:tail fiber protein [Salmonella enterica]|nr:tail fiber protein [Salmonella enterica]EBB7504843.1 tail fiber protein [Salmonella enterica]